MDVVLVDEGEDAEDEDAARDDLGPEHGRRVHEFGGICAEDAGRGSRARHRSDAAATFEFINGQAVVTVHDERSSHGTKDLTGRVHGELAPRVAAVQAVDEGDGRVQVSTGLAGDVDADHDTQSAMWSATRTGTHDQAQ